MQRNRRLEYACQAICLFTPSGFQAYENNYKCIVFGKLIALWFARKWNKLYGCTRAEIFVPD